MPVLLGSGKEGDSITGTGPGLEPHVRNGRAVCDASGIWREKPLTRLSWCVCARVSWGDLLFSRTKKKIFRFSQFITEKHQCRVWGITHRRSLPRTRGRARLTVPIVRTPVSHPVLWLAGALSKGGVDFLGVGR